MTRVIAATTLLGRLMIVALVAVYALVAVLLWRGKDFSNEGALSLRQPRATTEALTALGTTEAQLVRACFRTTTRSGEIVKIVTADISGRRLFACYDVDLTGDVKGVEIVDPEGFHVRDPKLLKPAGVWPHYAIVKSAEELVLGGFGVAVLAVFGLFVSTRRRLGPPSPDGPWWGSNGVLRVLAAVIVVGWVVIACLPRVPRRRKSRHVMWGIVGWGLFLGVVLFFEAMSKHDSWGMVVVSYLGGAAIGSYGIGRVRRPLVLKADAAEDDDRSEPDEPPWTAPSSQPPNQWSDQLKTSGQADKPDAEPARSADRGRAPKERASADLVKVQGPESLPSFGDVGGMVTLKKELKDTIGLLLAFSEQADAYRIRWNGVLLHGVPGTGKTFIAHATAGELGLNLLHVSTGDLVSAYRGESARNVDAVFRLARRNLPALLFFDEVDSIAIRRDDNPDQEARRTVNQLLQSLESTRSTRELIVMAATNDIGALDPAVIRPGRFDRHVHVPLPDLDARSSILAAQLKGRPGHTDVDVAEVARRTDGKTPATLAQIVSAASLQAMRESADANTHGQALVPLSTERLIAALQSIGGKDRPTVDNWSWDRLILPRQVKAELQEVAALAADPERAARFGVEPPSGVLLYGPPGTGKTTVARVLAAQASCSFYSVSAADLTSKWLGESERLIAQLFDRARANRPSIVFIDEIDAVAGGRDSWGSYSRQVNQLLQEIDGLTSNRGVIVVGATNRKDILDPAMLRGGRLSRHIEIPLPDKDGRRQMLEVFTAGMPLRDVDLDAVAGQTADLSGADIEALCQSAAVQAMMRTRRQDATLADPSVTAADFAAALTAQRPGLSDKGGYI